MKTFGLHVLVHMYAQKKFLFLSFIIFIFSLAFVVFANNKHQTAQIAYLKNVPT